MMTIAAVQRRLFAGTLACCVSSVASALAGDLLPAQRRVDWTPGVSVGVPGGIPTDRRRQIDVTQPPYGADKTGAADAHRAIQAAIDAASPGDVVYLPAGTYKLASTLTLRKSGATLRGEGEKTTVRCVGGACFAYVGANSDYQWNYPQSGNVVTAGLVKGGRQIRIADTSAFTVGRMARLVAANDTSLPVVSVGGYENLRGQLTRVTAKTATTLTLFPPLYCDYGGGRLAARINAAQARVVRPPGVAAV